MLQFEYHLNEHLANQCKCKLLLNDNNDASSWLSMTAYLYHSIQAPTHNARPTKVSPFNRMNHRVREQLLGLPDACTWFDTDLSWALSRDEVTCNHHDFLLIPYITGLHLFGGTHFGPFVETFCIVVKNVLKPKAEFVVCTWQRRGARNCILL